MLQYRLINGKQLSAGEVAVWSRIQQSQADYDSPYFRPEFTQAVAAVRDDVEVAVFEQQDQAVGFFPFQRGRWDIGRPVGGRLCDFQGAVVDGSLEWNVAELMRACGLAAWDFDHLPVSQRQFEDYHESVMDSPFIDVSGGYDAYLAAMKQAGSETLSQTLRKARKLEREIGPIRFDLHVPDQQILELMIQWKSQQYLNTQLTNIFSFPWTVALLEEILRVKSERFSAALSAMYAGDQLLAVHYGLISEHVLHSWFPTYDRNYGKYSPGMILMLEMAKAAAVQGIQRIDLGKGEEEYKRSLMTGGIPLADGSVEYQPMLRSLRRSWRRTRAWVRASPMRSSMPVRVARQVREWFEFK